jgi:putative DNA methylase
VTQHASKKAMDATGSRPALRGDLSFIETQFPVSKMSKESYAERKAVAGQTLTGLGKWWGRKPLVLCRATILGLLLPATDDAAADREVFLRLMTMDDDGMLQRKSSAIPAKELFRRLPLSERNRCFEPGSNEATAKLRRDLPKSDRDALQRRVFLSLPYEVRLEYCDRPEHLDGPSIESWAAVNRHLGTSATNLRSLVEELGRRRFGRVPRVGDSFCGGGSIPFEAARIGCEAYGSDLNPVAALLTWAALRIAGGDGDVSNVVKGAQVKILDEVDRQLTKWCIEHREPDAVSGRSWRAESFLYCTEASCPECGWRVPLSPSWTIAEKTNVIARLIPDAQKKRFDFEVLEHVSDQEFESAKAGTVRDSQLVCPSCKQRTPIKVIRGDGRGEFGEGKSRLRGWERRDVVPRHDDIFGERLYCIRWVDTWSEPVQRGGAGGVSRTVIARHYLAPTSADLRREETVLSLLMERLDDWQAQGFLPSRKIDVGAKTDEPIRTRGWTHWHHLYTPRQLLINGLLSSRAAEHSGEAGVTLTLLVGRLANWNSRLCRWQTGQGGGIGGGKDTFSNQALNTLYNYSTRGCLGLESAKIDVGSTPVSQGSVEVSDGRAVSAVCEYWITDPPYADAICYDEISELFLVWYEPHIRRMFPNWYTDSKRALAVKGSGDSFSSSMVEVYRRLAEHMSDGGCQVVMFTHQDAGVWADLALILWAAGLRVTAAWCIATETGPALGEGNYVQGTVLLVLRKAVGAEIAFLDEVYQDVEVEVRRQLDAMRDLDDARDPSFSDTDYQLAAYAAALRVLTGRKIEEIDVAQELARNRGRGEVSKVEQVIQKAVAIACDHLVPTGIDPHLWRSLSAVERLYVKGLEVEAHGERRQGVYMELARGFGVAEYRPLLASTKANETRLRSASEFGRKEMGEDAFGSSLVRHALFATFKTAETESPRDGIVWLKTEVPDYASSRQKLIDLLEYFASFSQNASMQHWQKDAQAAGILAGALRNRQDNV